MHAKLPLAAGFVLLALVSASAGYFAGRNETAAVPETIGGDSPAHPRRAPRFGITGESAPPKLPDSGAPSNLRGKDLGKILSSYSRMTPEQLEQEINRWRNTNLSYGLNKTEKTALEYLAYRWGQVSRKQAVEQLKNMGKFSNRIGGEVIQGWIEAQPEEAAAYLSEHLEDIPGARWLLRQFSRKMASISPDNALKWISGFSGNEREESLNAFLKEIAASHPEQLQHYIDKLSPKDTSDGLPYNLFLTQDVATGWEDTCRRIDSLKLESSSKDLLRMQALGKLCTVDFEKAMAEYQKLDEKNRKMAAYMITEGLAKKDPVAAVDWLRQNTPEEVAAQYMPGFGLFTNEFSNARLREYAEGLTGGPVKDALLAHFIAYETNLFNGQSYYTDKTLSLVNDIKDPTKKKEALSSALQSWSFQYPGQAKSWLNAAPLPDKLKQELLEELKKKTR